MLLPNRAGLAMTAGLAFFALTGPLLAGPFGASGYPATNGYNSGHVSYSTGPVYNSGAGNNGYNSGNVSYSTSPVYNSGPAIMQTGGCASCGTGQCATGNCHGPKEDCPPKYCHVFEGPPRLKYKYGCPRPTCDPCQLPHFGYFQTCWSPWPYGPDWRHCPYPTASDMLPPPQYPPYTPKLNAERPPYEPRRARDADKGRDRTREPDDDSDVPARPKPPAKKPELLPPGKLEKDKDKGKSDKDGPRTGAGIRIILDQN